MIPKAKIFQTTGLLIGRSIFEAPTFDPKLRKLIQGAPESAYKVFVGNLDESITPEYLVGLGFNTLSSNFQKFLLGYLRNTLPEITPGELTTFPSYFQ